MWLDQLSTKFDFSLGFKDAREICVFPVYLLRGHVACNRFSFHDPLATTTRIERRFRRISRFEWSFFFLFPPLFFYARTTFLFDPSRGQGLSSSTRNGREPPVMDRRFIPFDCNDGINSVSNRRRFRRGKQISPGYFFQSPPTFIKDYKRFDNISGVLHREEYNSLLRWFKKRFNTFRRPAWWHLSWVSRGV